MALINIDDKVQYQPNPLPEVNKWTAANINHFKQVINANAMREWDNTSNKFPDAGGSGASGAIEKHNVFIGIGLGSWEIVAGQGNQDVPDGTVFIARVNNPGQTPGNWRTV